MEKEELKRKLNSLVAYACEKISLSAADKQYTLNLLLDFFKCDAPSAEVEAYNDIQKDVIDALVDHAVDTGMTTREERLLFETKLLGMVTPAPSQVIADFDIKARNYGVKTATDWLFQISKANNYIRMPDIEKNLKWQHEGKFGGIDVTINLSKPEKDPKQIALAKTQKATGYPQCLLCATNMGFAGNLNHPARQTLRMIPIELNEEGWQLQFSPYQYYDRHVIALSDEHRPMKVDHDAFTRLMDFVDMFPHYFIGSNAALPIVGGSILSHDHFQGGSKVLPMFRAENRFEYMGTAFRNVRIYTVNWYNSVVRLVGRSREAIYAAACRVLDVWKNWNDESVGIFSKTGDEPHNAVTPIVRKENGEYVFELILRNNRTDDKHPYGIFHPEESLHNIKKEGIGIIEVMGLFILPGRLKQELEEVKKYLTGAIELNLQALSNQENPLYKHAQMIVQLINDYGVNLSADEAERVVRHYVNEACEKILECTAVFKNTEAGQEAFNRFMSDGIQLCKRL